MVTGVSYDFHVMAFSTVSESSEWWRSMAIIVIFGLMVATLLTLVVVPVLYALIEELKTVYLKATGGPFFTWTGQSTNNLKKREI